MSSSSSLETASLTIPSFLDTTTCTIQSIPSLDVFNPNNPYSMDYITYTTKEQQNRLYLKAQMKYNGQGWLGFGWSRTGNMVPGTGVIGLPGDDSGAVPQLYDLASYDFNGAGVKPLQEEEDDLQGEFQLLSSEDEDEDTTLFVDQNDEWTVMQFTISLDLNELEQDGSTFLWSYGFSNVLGFHEGYGRISLDLSNPCAAAVEATATPSLAPIEEIETIAPSKAPVEIITTVVPSKAAPIETTTTTTTTTAPSQAAPPVTSAPIPITSAPITSAPATAAPVKITEVPTATPSSAPSTIPFIIQTEAPITSTTQAPTSKTTEAPAVVQSSEAPSSSATTTTTTTTTSSNECFDYQFLLQLNEKLTFRYVVYEDEDAVLYLKAQLVFQGNAWLGWGVSNDGKMVGADLIMGLPATGKVELYRNTNYDPRGSGVQLLDSQTLLDVAIQQNNTSTTVMEFTKRLVDDDNMISMTVDGSTKTTMLYAYGFSNTFGIHLEYGSFAVELGLCDAGSGAELLDSGNNAKKEEYKTWYAAHGILASIAWGVLTPLAIGASLLRKWISSCGSSDPDSTKKDTWFQLHFYFNILTLILTSVSFGLVVAAHQFTSDDPKHFIFVTHATIGLVIMIALIVQVLGGIVRPPKESNNRRVLWKLAHRVLGIGLVALSWYQVQDGLTLFATLFQTTDYSTIFWAVAGSITGCILLEYLLLLLSEKKKKKKNDDNNSDKGGEVAKEEDDNTKELKSNNSISYNDNFSSKNLQNNEGDDDDDDDDDDEDEDEEEIEAGVEEDEEVAEEETALTVASNKKNGGLWVWIGSRFKSNKAEPIMTALDGPEESEDDEDSDDDDEEEDDGPKTEYFVKKETLRFVESHIKKSLFHFELEMGFNLLPNGECEIFYKGLKFRGFFLFRIVFELHALYYMWAMQRYMHSAPFGMDDLMDEAEKYRLNIPAAAVSEYLYDLIKDVEKSRKMALAKNMSTKEHEENISEIKDLLKNAGYIGAEAVLVDAGEGKQQIMLNLSDRKARQTIRRALTFKLDKAQSERAGGALARKMTSRIEQELVRRKTAAV